MRVAVTLVLVLGIAGVGCASVPAGRTYDSGDLRLRGLERGRGTVTVVFDSGMGDDLEVWRWVWPEVARFARVFVYDRAGLGRSGPGPRPRTSSRIAEELHTLLSVAGVEGPYVLVGHSFGGLNVRMFAARYPQEVAGIVLVEATPTGYPDRHDELLSEFDRSKLTTILSLGSEAARAERASAQQSAYEVREAPLPEGIPTIVLSSARREESEPFREAWTAMQDEMARSLGAERHTVTADSGHYIHFDEPHLVVEAIRELVTRAHRP